MPKKNSGMPWDKAILKVLTESHRVMKYYDIADTIISEGLRQEVGSTPANTVNAYLHGDKLKDLVVCVRRGEFILKEYLDKDPSLVISTADLPDDEEEKDMGDALITAYGRFWDREMWEMNEMSIYGTSSKTKKAASVDFSEHSGIYLLHKGYEVIYVGQATHLHDRLVAHTTDDKRNRWDNFSWFSLTGFDNENPENGADSKSLSIPAILDTLEALLIETLGPERNKKVGNDFEDKEFEQIEKVGYLERKLGTK